MIAKIYIEKGAKTKRVGGGEDRTNPCMKGQKQEFYRGASKKGKKW
jgi:hypothetical protein